MHKTFSCGVVLYNPTDSDLIEIKRYSELFDYVYVFDNTDTNYLDVYQKSINELISCENIKYFSYKKNYGLSFAYNKFLDECNTDYLCTMDQDSIFLRDDIINMKRKIETCKNDFALISPKIIYDDEKYMKRNEITKKSFVISSGSFFNIDILKKNNLKFDENYFIDRVDADICMQLINSNLDIYEYDGAFLNQNLGQKNGHKHPNHSVLRNYYIFRNRFYFNNKYFPKKKIILNVLQVLKHISLILLFENNKLKKIGMLFLAYSDYRNNNMGKFDCQKDVHGERRKK